LHANADCALSPKEVLAIGPPILTEAQQEIITKAEALVEELDDTSTEA